jgi:hypothetical protein
MSTLAPPHRTYTRIMFLAKYFFRAFSSFFLFLSFMLQFYETLVMEP